MEYGKGIFTGFIFSPPPFDGARVLLGTFLFIFNLVSSWDGRIGYLTGTVSGDAGDAFDYLYYTFYSYIREFMTPDWHLLVLVFVFDFRWCSVYDICAFVYSVDFIQT